MNSRALTPATGPVWAGHLADKLADSLRQHHGAAIAPCSDGEIHRLDHPDGRRGNQRLWYVLHPDFAVHGDWGTDERHLVFSDTRPDPIAATKARERVEAVRKARQQQRKAQQDAVAETCRREWQHLRAADSMHPYLVRKGIGPGGLRQSGASLVVPLTDGRRLVNVQKISTNGGKLFTAGGQVRGCFCLVGTIDPVGTLLICEGYATGATLYHETGHPVACAMNAGNLLPVAQTLRARYPHITLIVAADNDRHTPGNPGLHKARQAAITVEAQLMWPDFPCASCRCTDYNDLARCTRTQGGDA